MWRNCKKYLIQKEVKLKTQILSTNKIYRNAGNQPVIDQVKGENKLILDIGCGAGDNAAILTQKGHIVDGITLSHEEAEICKPKLRNVFVHNLEVGLPGNINDKYDYVICSHVLEHIAYPEKLLGDIKKVMKPDGAIIIALPNIMNYRPRLKLLLGKFEYEDSGIWDNTHLRWYTFQTGNQLLTKNGFQVLKHIVDGEIPFLRIFKFIPKATRIKILHVLTSISKGLFGSQFIYVGRPI